MGKEQVLWGLSPSSATYVLGKATSLSLSFPVCKMGVMVAPT